MGEAKELHSRRGQHEEGLLPSLWAWSPTPPIRPGPTPGLDWPAQEWGLGWVSGPAQEGDDRLGRIFNAQWQHKGGAGGASSAGGREKVGTHIRPCLFLPESVERWPGCSSHCWAGLSFTLGQVPWKTLVDRLRHTLTGSDPVLPLASTHTYAHEHSTGATG